MIAGNWINYDGLNLNYGTQKALPEIAGEFGIDGDQRVIEVYLNLAANTIAVGHNLLPVVPTYSTTTNVNANTTTAAAAGIISLTQVMPLQVYDNSAYVTSGAASSQVLYPQLFIESVETRTLIPGTSGTATSLNLGLTTMVTGQASGPSTWIVPVATMLDTSNSYTHFLNVFTPPIMKYIGQTQIIYPNANGAEYLPVSGGAGAGTWATQGVVPVTTTAQSTATGAPLATTGYLTAGAVTGPFAGGLLKIRIRYSMFGSSIPY